MKKTLLFVIDSLDIAGAEKSLVTLLSLLDFSKYTVDLQLFAYGHKLEKLIPKEVNLLQPLKYTTFTKLSFKESIKYSVIKNKYKMLGSRIKYSAKIRRKKYNNPQKAMLFWQIVANQIESNPKPYDIAISYSQGVPTYYVADKITANKKFAWVNVSYQPTVIERAFQTKYYYKYNNIIAVSDSTKEVLVKSFPNYENKINVIYDINNPEFIFKLAKMENSYGDSFEGYRILTIGRLANQKGYDIALKACKLLKEMGINFRWYVMGKGSLEDEIRDYIKDHNLTNQFILLGVKENPYPFIRDADLYVQTSRFEGFCLAIAEARMLNKPIVTTRFDAVYNQMIEGKNGLVVDINERAVCDGITRIMEDHKLKSEIISYLKKEKKGNTEEIKKFYELIS